MKTSCPRTDSFISTLVSEKDWKQSQFCFQTSDLQIIDLHTDEPRGFSKGWSLEVKSWHDTPVSSLYLQCKTRLNSCSLTRRRQLPSSQWEILSTSPCWVMKAVNATFISEQWTTQSRTTFSTFQDGNLALLQLTAGSAPYRLESPRQHPQYRVQTENTPISISRSRHFNTDMSWKPGSLLNTIPTVPGSNTKAEPWSSSAKAKQWHQVSPRCLS